MSYICNTSMKIDFFKKTPKKERISLRVTEDDKQFMKTFSINPAKVFDCGMIEVKKEIKKKKKVKK